MRSFISSAALASVFFGQAAFSAVSAHRHSHAHHHARAAEKRNTNIVANVLSRVGVTAAASDPTGFSVGSSSGPFVIDFCNESPKDIVVVLWSGVKVEDLYSNMCVNKYAPTLTESIPIGQNLTISVDPAALGGSVSGGWAALYEYTDLIIAGSINNTWGEYTYTTNSQFSAVDVSRLINMAGNEMSISTYDAYPPTGDALCVSDMDRCVFTCDAVDGVVPNTCPGGSLDATCTGDHTQNWGNKEGGCGGFTQQGGYTKVVFGK